jgi:hypothetical protein
LAEKAMMLWLNVVERNVEDESKVVDARESSLGVPEFDDLHTLFTFTSDASS